MTGVANEAGGKVAAGEEHEEGRAGIYMSDRETTEVVEVAASAVAHLQKQAKK